jgi:segregation and condensation protein A
MNETDYRVNLDMYNGPLDLLLYLIKKAEVEITDIPVALIADQYLAYVEIMQAFDVDVAAEFLLMASTLLEIKSRTLLPREEVNLDEIEDPRFELVTQLMEYKKFKGLSDELRAYALEREKKFARLAADRAIFEQEQTAAKPLEEIDLFDLVNAFSRMMKETLGAAVHKIIYDDVPVRDCMENLLARLRAVAVLAFREIFQGMTDRLMIISFFLALLELIRLKKIRAEQPANFGDIQIILHES